MSKQYTKEEVMGMFMDKVWSMVDYWNELEDKKTTRERISGTVFSLLAMLDGAGEIPSFIVAPSPHPEDKQFHIDENESYFPENHLLETKLKCDLGGSLHDTFYRLDPKKDVSRDPDSELEKKIIDILSNNSQLELSGRKLITPTMFRSIAKEISKELNK